MPKKTISTLYKEIEKGLTSKEFLEKTDLTKKKVLYILKNFKWRENISNLVAQDTISCKDVFEYARASMEYFVSEPEPNWLNYIHEYLITELYPHKETFISKNEKKTYAPSIYFYLEVLRVFLLFEAKRNPVPASRDLKFLKSEDLKRTQSYIEYQRLKRISKELYVFELFKISREIMPFDLFSHISGVHYVATHCAKQLSSIGVPVDLSLVSGAAITHDIGKFGCNKKEVSRIPYLHYYYTDVFCQRVNLPQISHIASNHSTWDLELENLSAEALLLIYADFRVKSTRENGVEITHFYSLKEAFDVILSKLDNVDMAKEMRYKKVYAKLKDFEDYMVQLGVNTDLTSCNISKNKMEDVHLLTGMAVVDRLKFMSVEHNIKVMNGFNDEVTFAGLIETARSEKNWKNLRGHLNIIKEYYTYMTKKQKQMTLRFMFDLLGHREGDVRREAAQLFGNIISTFDEEYRKELPEGAHVDSGEINSFKLLREYLEKIIVTDLKTTDQQKRWMGYTLKSILGTILKKARENEKPKYVNCFVEFLRKTDYDDITTFILLEALFYVPLEYATDEDREIIKHFVDEAANRQPQEISIAVYKITKGLKGSTPQKGSNTELFRENLKVDTPWIVKSQNIEVLLERMVKGNETSTLQIATHFSNLIKVCDKVTVRHKAGRSLIKVAAELTLDQRNELAIELMKGLEIGEYEYSKYIPEYLGKLAIMLHPDELDEFLKEIKKLSLSTNERVACVALDTIGRLLCVYEDYKGAFDESEEKYNERKEIIIGMLLKGLSNYNDTVSQEAFVVIGQYLFGDENISDEVKFDYFKIMHKKIAVLLNVSNEDTMTFYNHAANLNHIYRFISDYLHTHETMNLEKEQKIAFFPGTFDPFSLGHKEIARTIRDLGFVVYLAIDEFSWSKKTQPHMIRRKIASMSVADEMDIYIFPDDVPVNIANSESIKELKETLKSDDVYIVVGSDVVKNASSYEKDPEENSIHSLNHIVFKRVTGEDTQQDEEIEEEKLSLIKGDIVRLKLPTQFEDISSTRIRENVDSNREISYLIDPLVQNYIYEKGLYIREPQYKGLPELESLKIGSLRKINPETIDKVDGLKNNYSKEKIDLLKQYIQEDDVKSIVIRNGNSGDNIVAIGTAKEVSTSNLYEEFNDLEIAQYIRSKVRGKVLVIGDIYIDEEIVNSNICQVVVTELLADALKDDFNYAIYNPILKDENEYIIKSILALQGFKPVVINGEDKKIMSVDMRNPVVLIHNTESTLKAPFNKEPQILRVLEIAHERIQRSLTKLYPDNLVLSINLDVMQNKLIKIVRNENKPDESIKSKRKLGNNMCVPFGEVMKSTVIPNTVTKSIHMEKVFAPVLASYDIKESQHYGKLIDQIRTIKAFNRPVILLDDILHKGYRLQKLSPLLDSEMVEVKCVVAGVVSANGKDLAKCMGGRKIKSGYYLPNMLAWFNESGQYPFIGGDAVMNRAEDSVNTAVNLILPYAAPVFLQSRDKKALYNFSMTCLENSRDILVMIEKLYQEKFERKLTVGRLSEVFKKVCIPDMDGGKLFNDKLSPSDHIKLDIDKLTRLKGLMY